MNHAMMLLPFSECALKMSQKLSRLILSVFSCVYLAQANAEVAINDGKISIQNVMQPELYVFCSKKQTTLMLNRTEFDNPGVQAGWSTELAPFACTVFFTDKSPFVFSCSQETPGALNAVDCNQYLLISRFPWGGAFLASNPPTGSYWVAENIASDDVPLVLRHQGFDV